MARRSETTFERFVSGAGALDGIDVGRLERHFRVRRAVERLDFAAVEFNDLQTYRDKARLFETPAIEFLFARWLSSGQERLDPASLRAPTGGRLVIQPLVHRYEQFAYADSREDEIDAWLARFGKRKRQTITRDEVRRQIKDWEEEGLAASTVRHRMTALSTLYDVLDGDEAYNPVKGVKRPKEAEPKPDSRPPHIIMSVLDELWFRAAMNNRGWKTLARALVLGTHGNAAVANDATRS